MNGARLPLVFSVLGHLAGLAAIAWLTTRPLLPPPPVKLQPVAVVFATPTPPTVAPPEPTPPPPPPPPEPAPPPPPPPPAVVSKPPPPPPPPHHKPVRVVRRPEPVQMRPLSPTPPPPQVAPPPPPQIASLPPPTPTPPRPAPAAISGAWRAALGAWLQSHKTYPETARERGEEGAAVLRFRVDRSGRVLGYSVVRGTGHPDLDAAVGDMIRNATLPAFPESMPQPEIEVSVTVRFALR